MLEILNNKKNKLITTLNPADISDYLAIQCNNFFPDKKIVKGIDIINYVKNVLDKIEFCFKHVTLNYYNKNGSPFFNHLNSDHYCIFLCYLAREIYTNKEDISISSKIFLLNKALHGIDSFYGIELPDIFIVCHPLGTVLGNAVYADKMVFYQNVTVGSTTEGVFPKFLGSTILYSNSSVIGNCVLGKNVIIGANSSIINLNIQDNFTVLGSYPNNKLIKSKNQLEKIFK